MHYLYCRNINFKPNWFYLSVKNEKRNILTLNLVPLSYHRQWSTYSIQSQHMSIKWSTILFYDLMTGERVSKLQLRTVKKGQSETVTRLCAQILDQMTNVRQPWNAKPCATVWIGYHKTLLILWHTIVCVSEY